ncbi:MAG: hypothetical protein F6K23_18295 [Okeania sp. SIO2C9]|uniref:hypothetical protein n=1 Tax=Okeania sp. SIO2C9 TaxID=2607791 RepID=UPI0013C13258|nr:hypothetical protein [Okeania sp. SIO2C9]NEQ74821.1 hypothetical protein [Okeania sp. SIO2C9]
MSKVVTEFINSTKKSLVRSLTLTVAATSAVTFLSAISAYAGGPLKARVISIDICTENYGVLKGHDLAVARVFDDKTGKAPSTFVVYSTYPGHGLNRPEFLQMARESEASGRYLDFYWSDNKGSNICGVTSPSRYHFLQDMRYIR